MPGIAGILAARGLPEAAQLLEVMLQSMMHETFYTKSSHLDSARGWFTGSVAMADSFADGGPARNQSGRVVLSLAGECFLDAELKSALLGGGHCFDGASCLMHLYEEEGPGFVARLNGLCSGILLDAERGRAVLFNDRYGLQRVYYHQDGSGLYFASEAKALLAALPHLRQADLKSLAEYCCFDCVLDERSYFRGVEVLPAGSLWVQEKGRVEKSIYYEPGRHVGQPALESAEFSERLTATFAQAVERRVEGDKVGIALTGGLDTRFIMSCLPAERGNLTSFTFGGMYRDSNDVRLARAVGKACQVPHQALRLDRDFLLHYGDHAARAMYVTDGQADATNVDNLYLNSRARNLAQIKLSGAFGSQVLGRVRRALRYRPPAPELFHGDFRPRVEEAIESLTPWRDEPHLTYCLKRETPWYWSRFIVSEMSQFSLRLPFLDRDFVDLLEHAPLGGFDGSSLETEAIGKRNRALLGIRTNKGAGGTAPPPFSSLLRIFLRARGLMEKAYNWEALPYSLHHAVARADSMFLSPLRLNRLILDCEYFRHYNHWYRNELAPYLQEVLLDRKTLERPYWNAANLTRIVNDHVRGRRNNLAEIRKVLSIELMHRAFLDEAGTRLSAVAGMIPQAQEARVLG